MKIGEYIEKDQGIGIEYIERYQGMRTEYREFKA